MLYAGQAKVIGSPIGADGDAVAAGVVRAIDDDAAHTHLAHLAEGDLLWAALFHFFAFSPISTKRRMASGRLIFSPCASIQSSIASNCSIRTRV